VSLADKIAPAPREVRLAGLITGLLGAVLLAFGIVLISAPSVPGNNVAAEAAFYGVFAVGVLVCGAGLALGHTWARSPVVVVALMTAGVGWYLAVPSGQPGPGVPIILVGLLLLVLLFRRPSRAWAMGQREGESEQDAAERGGLEGRAAARRDHEERSR